MSECVFCNEPGSEVIYNCELFRIVDVADESYPGYLRVILNRHTKELSDLSLTDNLALYQAVIKCEQILRDYLRPDKINLASFGNMTPHVHWHIIPRFLNDKHFPNPVWGEITNSDYFPQDETLLAASQMTYLFSEIF